MPEKFSEPSSTFCSLAWTHQFVGSGGRLKPCCRFQGGTIPKEHDLRTGKPLQELFHSDFMQEVRAKMLKGEEVSGCTRCYEEERAGKKRSLRQYYNSEARINSGASWEQPEIRYLELSFSNLCNLKCRMCDPNFSIEWYKDWEELEGKSLGAHKIRTIDPSLLQSSLSNLRHLKLTGGEPFMIPEYRRVLEMLVDQGIASQVYLNYSTNLTVMPSIELIRLWKKFKSIEIAFSLDGVGPVIEYVRHPTRWTKVEQVTKLLLSLSKEMNLTCGLRPSIMVYNVLDLPNIVRWWKSQVDAHYIQPYTEESWVNPTHVTFPRQLSLKVLPAEQKRMVREHLMQAAPSERWAENFDHFCKFMEAEDRSDLLPEFRRYTNTLDRLRSEDFSRVVPQLATIMQ